MGEHILPLTPETRNSWLRHQTQGFTREVVTQIHELVPGLIPDDFTFGGWGLVTAGAIIANKRNGISFERDQTYTIAASAFIAAGLLCDAVDGQLARLLNELHPGSIDTKKGGLKDAGVDRAEELVLALSRADSAHKRGDTIGEYAALANAITNSWTSTARALSEMYGIPVPETGKDFFGFLGSRGGRATLHIFATLFPTIKGVPVQPIADIVGSVANVRTTMHRLQIAYGDGEAALPYNVRQDAQERFKVMGTMAGISLGAVAVYKMKQAA